jgi:hypothetical protein
MNKINNTQKIILFIFSCFFLVIPVFGNVNLTFQSDNEKIINIIDIDNGYSQITSNSTNQTISLPYNNYNIKLYATNTKIANNNGSFLINNLKPINSDWQVLFWIALIIGLIFLVFKIFGSKL